MPTGKFWLLCLCPHRPHTLFLSHLKFGSDIEPLEECLRSYHLQTPKSPTIISGKSLDPIQNPYSSSLSRSSFWLVKAINWKVGLHPAHLDAAFLWPSDRLGGVWSYMERFLSSLRKPRASAFPDKVGGGWGWPSPVRTHFASLCFSHHPCSTACSILP